MIIVISRKTFDQKHKKLLKVKEYTIIDGSDDSGTKTDLAKEYRRVIPLGDFTPGNKLVKGILAKNKGIEEISPRKLNDMRDEYLSDRDFIAAILQVCKVFVYENDEHGSVVPLDKNIFIVITGKLYKALGKDIVKAMRNLFDKVDAKFILSEKDILDNPDLLDKEIKRKKIKQIAKRISELEKKYKLK